MLYFAYGSNMDPVQMAKRCPGATPLGPARLADHRLTFTWDSARWGGGVGHVEAAPGEQCWGVLWDLTDAHLASLDRYEQVSQEVYRRERMMVEADDGPVEAWIYLSNDGRFRAPSRRYVKALVRGATHFGFPPEEVARISAVLHR